MTPSHTQIAERLREYAGWLPSMRSPALAAAIARCVAHTDAASIQEYSDLLSREPDELMRLAEEAAVYESYFFRERTRLAWIQQALLKPARAPFTAWSAGCAAGEEPYTLAILAAEAGSLGAVRISGTDLSARAIERAQAGRYPEWSLRGVEPDERERWFTHDGEQWQIDEAVAGQVAFARHNLASRTPPPGAPPGGYDLILCRNVLVYFDPALLDGIARFLVSQLTPDGLLVTGVSDPLLPIETVAVPGGIAYRRAP